MNKVKKHTEQLLNKKTVHQGKFLNYTLVTYLDHHGKEHPWETIERTHGGNVVSIIAITENRELILIEQYRPAVNSRVVELPAGLCDMVGKSIIETGEIKLRQETGYIAQQIKTIFSGSPTSAGLSNETRNFVLAERLIEGVQELEESENIEVHLVPLDKVISFLLEKQANGCMTSDSILAGLFMYQHQEQFFQIIKS